MKIRWTWNNKTFSYRRIFSLADGFISRTFPCSAFSEYFPSSFSAFFTSSICLPSLYPFNKLQFESCFLWILPLICLPFRDHLNFSWTSLWIPHGLIGWDYFVVWFILICRCTMCMIFFHGTKSILSRSRTPSLRVTIRSSGVTLSLK